MNTELREILWKQFGASIDMLENAVAECPEKLWNSESGFWYIAYHTLFFLDYYLTDEPEKFMPPVPFTLSEFDPEGKLPERVYSKEELLKYISHCRKKCRDLIAGLTEENSTRRFKDEYRDYNIIEILIYNMRHVQHHMAQLNLLLRQNTGNAPDWISVTKISL